MRLSIFVTLFLTGCATTGNVDTLHGMDKVTFRRELVARFQYGPPQPSPQRVSDAHAGQVVDAVYFAAFAGFDRSYTTSARTRARHLSAKLVSEASDLNRAQFTLRVAEIVALADNAHTMVGGLDHVGRMDLMSVTPRLPVRTYLFPDGLYVLRTNQANADLLGARIDQIEGRRIDSIYANIRRYWGGTEANRRRQLIPMLESPSLLQAAGLASNRDNLLLSGVLADGRPFQRRIAVEEGESIPNVPTRRLLYPTRSADSVRSFLPETPNLPVFLRNGMQAFWRAPLDADGLYVRLSQNVDGVTSLSAFLADTLAYIRAEHPSYVVLDMRMNTGGDGTLSYAFARELPAAASHAPIYALTSPWTLSAAMWTIAALKEVGGEQVAIVGEPVGDRLDYWSEGGQFVLPNIGVTVAYTAGRHVLNRPCRDIEQCFWLDYTSPVRVRTLAPEISLPLPSRHTR